MATREPDRPLQRWMIARGRSASLPLSYTTTRDTTIEMKKFWSWAFSAALCIAVIPTAAQAGWKLIPAHAPAKIGPMTVMPGTDWNQASARPGKQGVTWTHDGFELNQFDLFSAVPSGQTVYADKDKKRNPMPRFEGTMLLIESGDFFERVFRARSQAVEFVRVSEVPSKLSGHAALEMRYGYVTPDSPLRRQGFARLTVVDGRLYVLNYTGPSLHYFEDGLQEVVAVMDSAKF